MNMTRGFVRAITVVSIIMSAVATTSATPIRVGFEAAKFVIKRQTSIASTFAVAHTLSGTGGAGLSPGGCGPKVSITGAAVSCTSSDFAPHPPPVGIVGNDVAIANAFGVSWGFLGGAGIATVTPTTALKGDFAAAGAYARGGASVSAIGGSLAQTGQTKATASVTVGGITVTGSKDPGFAFFGAMVSDLDPLVMNQIFLNEEVGSIPLSLGDYVDVSLAQFVDSDPDRPNPVVTSGMPNHIYWALYLRLDGNTGQLSVVNFGEGVTPANMITAADFQNDSTSSDWVHSIIGNHTVDFDIPWSDPNANEQFITLDAAYAEVEEGVPEPDAIVLVGMGKLFLLLRLTRRSRANGEKRSP